MRKFLKNIYIFFVIKKFVIHIYYCGGKVIMINKQSMWFLTLLSLVLVLGVYYVTMPNDLLSSKIEGNDMNEQVDVKVSEGDILIAMRANRDEKVSANIEELQKVLTSTTASSDEKNNAFEELKLLNLNMGKEEELENKIEEKFGIKSYIEINKDNIKVVINSKEHDASLANNIMRSLQEEYKEKMYITVQFE